MKLDVCVSFTDTERVIKLIIVMTSRVVTEVNDFGCFIIILCRSRTTKSSGNYFVY